MASKFPAKLGACIDLAYETRGKRLEKQKVYEDEIAEMKRAEDAIEEHIIKTFGKVEIEGAKGTYVSASISRVIYPEVKDWNKVYAWVKKTGAFEIFEKRIARGAFKERVEKGETVPGVESYEKMSLSLTKIKK